MSTPNDGGPAFPTHPAVDPDNGEYNTEPGMTLRDWFAGKALQGLIADPISYNGALVQIKADNSKGGSADICSVMARWSYDYADAMLAERSRHE